MDEHERAVHHLLEIWKVLEVLTVSLDHIGMYKALTKEKQNQSVFDEFIGPSLFHRIAVARAFAHELLETYDPDILEKLEKLSDDEESMGYWRAPLDQESS